MDQPSDRVPDGITPLVGYRVWQVIEEGGNLVFLPLSNSSRDWEGPGWVSSTCSIVPANWVSPEGAVVPPEGEVEWTPSHEAPDEDCTCGFYAMKELAPELLHTASLSDLIERVSGSGVRFVLGRVELAGKVIEHERGYRAERARIVELIPLRGTERAVEALARRVGVGVARSVKVDRVSRLRGRLRLARVAWVASRTKAPTHEDPGRFYITLCVITLLAFAASHVTPLAESWRSAAQAVLLGSIVMRVVLLLLRRSIATP
jgi:hypothetical protein